MNRFSDQAEQTLRRAGWNRGRQVPDLVASWSESLRSAGADIFPSAEKALLEFGGLKIDEQGPGVTCSREPFEIDPILGDYEREAFEAFSNRVGTRLYPLGEAEGGLCFLGIGENGCVYIMMMDEISLLGNNMDEALEALLIGLQPSPVTPV